MSSISAWPWATGGEKEGGTGNSRAPATAPASRERMTRSRISGVARTGEVACLVSAIKPGSVPMLAPVGECHW